METNLQERFGLFDPYVSESHLGDIQNNHMPLSYLPLQFQKCQRTVPEVIIAFLEARNFEDVTRNAVSLGGDTDTLGAITGSIAEAFYGIPAVLIAECRRRLDEGLMTDVLDEFDRVLGRNGNADSDDKKDD